MRYGRGPLGGALETGAYECKLGLCPLQGTPRGRDRGTIVTPRRALICDPSLRGETVGILEPQGGRAAQVIQAQKARARPSTLALCKRSRKLRHVGDPEASPTQSIGELPLTQMESGHGPTVPRMRPRARKTFDLSSGLCQHLVRAQRQTHVIVNEAQARERGRDVRRIPQLATDL